jgi:uncharacterized protein YxjI
MTTQAIATIQPNEHDRFELRQRFRPIVNQYEFTLPPPEGEKAGPPVAFVEQKRFKFKEDIRFYADESKTTELLRIKARQRFDPRARYDVTDPAGNKVGEIQKVFGESLLRSTYRLYDAAGNEVAVVTEKSLGVALFRRLVGFIPYVDNFADWLPIPYHFVFKRGEEILGTHSRATWKFRDTYHLDLTADPQRTIDRRLVLAIAVGLDALQAR